MQVRLSFPVDTLAGKGGGAFGLVFSKWRGLQVARRLVVPANPGTTEQDTIRGYLATAAAAFQSVTPSEKLDWEAWAEINASNILGQRVVRPAISEYCAINVMRQINGQATTDVAPTSKPAFAVTGITSVTNTGPGTSVDIVYTHNDAAPSGTFVLVRITLALPSLMVVPRTSDFRLIEGVADVDSIQTVTASPQTMVFTAPQNFPAVGAVVGVRITPLNASYAKGVQFGSTETVV